MTPYELSVAIYRDLSPVAPKLAAAVNRALNTIGESSLILSPGQPSDATFQETEVFHLAAGEAPTDILLRIFEPLELLERYSTWRVTVDKKPSTEPGKLELLYTLFRLTRCQ